MNIHRLLTQIATWGENGVNHYINIFLTFQWASIPFQSVNSYCFHFACFFYRRSLLLYLAFIIQCLVLKNYLSKILVVTFEYSLGSNQSSKHDTLLQRNTRHRMANLYQKGKLNKTRHNFKTWKNKLKAEWDKVSFCRPMMT